MKNVKVKDSLVQECAIMCVGVTVKRVWCEVSNPLHIHHITCNRYNNCLSDNMVNVM